MKLFNKKQQSEDVKNIIEILNLKNQPYEIKEDAVCFMGIMLPITTLCVTNALIGQLESFIALSFSFFPSFAMIVLGAKYANLEEERKRFKASKTYANFDYEYVDYLTQEEKQKLLDNSNKFESDSKTIEQMANNVKIANARRNAKYISKEEYRKQLNFAK